MRATRLVILAALIGCTSLLWSQSAPNRPADPNTAATQSAASSSQNPAPTAQSTVPQSDPPVATAGDPPSNAETLAPGDFVRLAKLAA